MNVIPVQWAGRQRASKSQAINMAQSTKNNPILRIHCSGDTRERERERANDYSSHVTLWEETRESAAETSVRGRSCPLTEAWPAMGRGGNPPGCCLASAAALPPCRPAALPPCRPLVAGILQLQSIVAINQTLFYFQFSHRCFIGSN